VSADIQIINGDCRIALETIPDGSVDLVVTDPPYSSGARRDAERQVRGESMVRGLDDAEWFSHDTMTTWGFTWFMRNVFVEIRNKLKGGSHLYVFCDWRQTPNVYGLLESCGYRVNHCLVWNKEHYGMGTYWRNQHENIVFASLGMPNAMLNRGMGSVLGNRGVSPRARVHPTEKPLELIKSIIAAVPGDVVLDPFMGSGTTLVAAKELGRKAIGIEIDPTHCETAKTRLQEPVAA
jgi:site-specific DNA-methyltransferase (adenine-specific)